MVLLCLRFTLFSCAEITRDETLKPSNLCECCASSDHWRPSRDFLNSRSEMVQNVKNALSKFYNRANKQGTSKYNTLDFASFHLFSKRWQMYICSWLCFLKSTVFILWLWVVAILIATYPIKTHFYLSLLMLQHVADLRAEMSRQEVTNCEHQGMKTCC